MDNWCDVIAGVISGWHEHHVSILSPTQTFPLLIDFWSSVAAAHRDHDALVTRRSTTRDTGEQQNQGEQPRDRHALPLHDVPPSPENSRFQKHGRPRYGTNPLSRRGLDQEPRL